MLIISFFRIEYEDFFKPSFRPESLKNVNADLIFFSEIVKIKIKGFRVRFILCLSIQLGMHNYKVYMSKSRLISCVFAISRFRVVDGP
jgi:hypothetical protein